MFLLYPPIANRIWTRPRVPLVLVLVTGPNGNGKCHLRVASLLPGSHLIWQLPFPWSSSGWGEAPPSIVPLLHAHESVWRGSSLSLTYSCSCYPPLLSTWQHDQGFTSRKTVERSWFSISNFWCWYSTEQRGLSCPVTSVNGPQFSHSFWILAPHLQRSACIDRYFILWLHFAKPCCRSSFLLLRCLFHFARSDIRVRRKRCGKMTGLSAMRLT